MSHPNSDHKFSTAATRLANAAWLCWLAAVAVGGLCYYLDAYAAYRDIRGIPKGRIEDYCLWFAAMAATTGIVTSVVGWVVMRWSEGRFRLSYRLSIGMVLNLLTLLAVLFTQWAREVLKAA